MSEQSTPRAVATSIADWTPFSRSGIERREYAPTIQTPPSPWRSRTSASASTVLAFITGRSKGRSTTTRSAAGSAVGFHVWKTLRCRLEASAASIRFIHTVHDAAPASAATSMLSGLVRAARRHLSARASSWRTTRWRSAAHRPQRATSAAAPALLAPLRSSWLAFACVGAPPARMSRAPRRRRAAASAPSRRRPPRASRRRRQRRPRRAPLRRSAAPRPPWCRRWRGTAPERPYLSAK